MLLDQCPVKKILDLLSYSQRAALATYGNGLLARSGLQVRRLPRPLIDSGSILEIDLEFAIAHLAAQHPGRQLTVVQLGANDGEADDPLRASIATHSMRAVLVEPQPTPFARLAARYDGNPEVTVVNAAISHHDGVRDLFTLDDDVHSGLASFSADQVRSTAQWTLSPEEIEERLIAIKVPTLTIDTLLAETGIKHVDILQVDVEGFDLEALRLFDIPRRLPTIVNYERTNLSTQDKEAAVSLLLDAGYSVSDGVSTRDTLAYRRATSDQAGLS